MIAVLVVVVLFVKVLERFGLLAAIYDGKEMANSFHTEGEGGCLLLLCSSQPPVAQVLNPEEQFILGLFTD